MRKIKAKIINIVKIGLKTGISSDIEEIFIITIADIDDNSNNPL